MSELARQPRRPVGVRTHGCGLVLPATFWSGSVSLFVCHYLAHIPVAFPVAREQAPSDLTFVSHLGGTAFARSSDSGVTWQTLTANADCNYVANAGAVYYCTVESSKSVIFNALTVLAVAVSRPSLFQCIT